MDDSRKINAVPFEEALTNAGNGLYNILLASTGALILLAIGIDLFGFSLVVAAACDLDLTVSQKGILTSLPFVGILLVSYFWGYISDTRGRRFTLVLCLQIGFVLNCICSFCSHWLILGLFKFLSVCFSCAANSTTYTLVGESCMQRVRNKYMLLMTCLLLLSPAAAGVLTYPTLKLEVAVELTWLNVVFRPWRLLIIVLAFPCGIGGIIIYYFYESPKFLAISGKKDRALEVLKRIYAVNQTCRKTDSQGFKVDDLILDENPSRKDMSLLHAMYEQSALLFRKPYLWRTLQLFYIVAVVYITNNSFLVWLPHILNLVRISLQSEGSGSICSLISTQSILQTGNESEPLSRLEYITNDTSTEKFQSPEICIGTIEENVIITLIASQSVFSFLNFVISHLPNRRKAMLILILGLSSLSGLIVNLTTEPISSVFFFMVFTCTCLGMGILASYFVDLYPTSHRGMVACLSIMVGRSSAFIGINLVGNLIFNYCQITFYLWSLLVLSSVVAAWFLPPDKPAVKATAL